MKGSVWLLVGVWSWGWDAIVLVLHGMTLPLVLGERSGKSMVCDGPLLGVGSKCLGGCRVALWY